MSTGNAGRAAHVRMDRQGVLRAIPRGDLGAVWTLAGRFQLAGQRAGPAGPGSGPGHCLLQQHVPPQQRLQQKVQTAVECCAVVLHVLK